MKSHSINNKVEFTAPTPVLTAIFQISGIFAFVMLSFEVIILAFIKPYPKSFYMELIFCAFSILMALIILYVPKRYRTLLRIEKDKNMMMKIKKGQATVTYNLDKIKGLISKRMSEPFWCQYKLILQFNDDQEIMLFNEWAAQRERHWEQFAEKISNIIDKPLKKELWGIDLNGKKTLLPFETVKSDRKKILPLLLFIITSFLGALIYRFFTTAKMFVFVGFLVVFINTAILLYVDSKDKDTFEKFAGRKFVRISIVLVRSIVLNIMYYLFFAFILTIQSTFFR